MNASGTPVRRHLMVLLLLLIAIWGDQHWWGAVLALSWGALAVGIRSVGWYVLPVAVLMTAAWGEVQLAMGLLLGGVLLLVSGALRRPSLSAWSGMPVVLVLDTLCLLPGVVLMQIQAEPLPPAVLVARYAAAVLGIVLLLPLAAWESGWRAMGWSARLEAALVGVQSLLIGLLVFALLPEAVAHFVLLPLVWCAARLPLGVAGLALASVALLAGICWHRDLGPFAGGDDAAALLHLQGFLLTVVAVVHLVGWITARADRHRRLQRHQSGVFREVVEDLEELLVRRDRNGRIVVANSCYDRWQERHADGGSDPLEFQGVPSAQQETERTDLAAGRAVVHTSTYTAGDTGHHLQWRIRPLRDARGAAHGYQAVGNDITALEHARQQAEAAVTAKGVFLANTSHELRTPLNGMLGLAELLAEEDLPPLHREYVDGMLRSGTALVHVIDDILDLSRIEHGRITLQERPFDPMALVDGVLESLAATARAKGLVMSSGCAPQVPVRVLGDEDRVRQVLANLVGNAIKYTEAGSVHVVLDAGPEQDGVVRLALAVHDTGIGVPAHEQEAIFEHFTQGSEAAGRAVPGAGLGLSIVRELVQLMGGETSVRSGLGAGSTFTCTWPAAVVEGPAPALPRHVRQGLVLLAVSGEGLQRALGDWFRQRGVDAIVCADATALAEYLVARGMAFRE
ncbi:MAG: ATP-binding protein, partial [Planctomycetota bacterium]